MLSIFVPLCWDSCSANRKILCCSPRDFPSMASKNFLSFSPLRALILSRNSLFTPFNSSLTPLVTSSVPLNALNCFNSQPAFPQPHEDTVPLGTDLGKARLPSPFLLPQCLSAESVKAFVKVEARSSSTFSTIRISPREPFPSRTRHSDSWPISSRGIYSSPWNKPCESFHSFK